MRWKPWYREDEVRDAVSASRSVRGHRGHRPRPEARKVERPSLEQLEEDLSRMSHLAVGRKYGASDNAVRKWLRSYRQAAGIGTTMGQP